MKLWAFARSGVALRSFSLAVMLSFAAVVAAPAVVHAEEDLVPSAQKTKRSIFSPRQTSNANTASHAAGSGTKSTTQTAVLNDGSVSPFITPESPANIQAMADKYAKIVADGGWPRLPKGNLKKGAKGKNSGILNQRLYIEGYLRVEGTQGEFAQLFTSATEEALMKFQRNHGLAATGKVDGVTLFALNVPAEKRLATIRAMMASSGDLG